MRTNHPSLPPRPTDPCPSSSSKAPLPQRRITSSSMVASSSSSVPIPTTGHRLPPPPTGSPLPPYTSSSLHSPSSSSSSGRTPATSYYQYYHYAGGVTAGSSSYSPSGSTLPSPSTSSVTSSASSSGSSLRTPPELLLQRHGMATMTTRDGGLVVIHANNGKSMGGLEVDVRRLDRAAKRFLSIQEIDKRLQLLDSVALDNLDPTIPSAPPVLKQKSRPLSSSVDSQPGVSTSIDSRVSASGSKPAASSSSSSMAVSAKKPPSGQLLRSPPPITSKTAKSTEEEVTPKAQRMAASSSSISNGSGAKKRRRSISVEEGLESGQVEDVEVRKKSRPRTSGNRDYTSSASPPPTKSRADGYSSAAAKKPVDTTKGVSAPLQRSKSSSSVPAFSRIPSSAPPARTWTKAEFARLATIYQSRGRSLKHSGDRRTRDASPTASSTSRNNAQIIANYEQTEAIVLYLYAFWCEDQSLPAGSSSSRPCILTNWTSLSGLLHHVHRNHEKQGEHLLAALCLLLEAVVLKQVAGAEQRLIQQKMSQVANRTMAASTPGASSSSSGNALSEVSSSLMDLSSSMTKVLADEERSSKLFGLVRGTILCPDFFRLKLPKVYEACQKASVATSSERVGKMALALDPGSLPSVEDGSTKEERWTWTWPLPLLEGSTMTTSINSQSSSTTASALHIPHLVCFARAVLQERARQKGVTDYRVADISTTGGQ